MSDVSQPWVQHVTAGIDAGDVWAQVEHHQRVAWTCPPAGSSSSVAGRLERGRMDGHAVEARARAGKADGKSAASASWSHSGTDQDRNAEMAERVRVFKMQAELRTTNSLWPAKLDHPGPYMPITASRTQREPAMGHGLDIQSQA